MNAVVAPSPLASEKVWSEYQQGAFDWVANGTGNAILVAVAGSGKTTTIEECTKRIGLASYVYLVFNKANSEEAKARGINARTFHSLTYSIVLRERGARTVEANKLRNLIGNTLSETNFKLYGTFLQRLVSLGKQAGLGCEGLLPIERDSWAMLAEHHDLDVDSDSADIEEAYALATQVLFANNTSHQVDFDDLLYFPVLFGYSLPKFDFVFIDEAQDTNPIRRAIIAKVMHKASRMMAVGDPAQAIYGFTGADNDSLDLIAAAFNCVKLPLTVSYRCPANVVKAAQAYVSHIEAAPNAPEGDVKSLGENWKHTDLQPNDLVVCRTTRPVITLAYALLKQRVNAQVMGRELGTSLVSLVKKMNAKGIDALQTKIEAWAAREVEKFTKAGKEGQAQTAQDKADAILCLVDSMPETGRTVPGLIAAIENLFADKRNAVKLATIHRSKGLEANRVYWLNSSQCPSKWAKKDWQKAQEVHLCYVAVTRAKQALYTIEEHTKKAA